jgi:hypothetical protein
MLLIIIGDKNWSLAFEAMLDLLPLNAIPKVSNPTNVALFPSILPLPPKE